MIIECIGIFDKVEKSSVQNKEDFLLEISDETHESNNILEINDDEGNIKIDINKANSKEVRNIVRKILKNKFGMYNNVELMVYY